MATLEPVFSIILALGFLAAPLAAEAQQPKKAPRIAYLTVSPASSQAPRLEGFRQGLRELGYVEGTNILIEYRFADGKLDRVPALAAELVGLKVDVIVTAGPTVTRAVKHATNTIPIVMAQDPDPVGNGFVASLARPGGNITGLSTLSPEISGKQLELLKEIVPGLSRLAVLGNSDEPGNAQSLRELDLAARAFAVQLQYLDIRDPKEIETAFRDARKGRADAILVLSSSVFNVRRTQLVELAARSRLPTAYSASERMQEGWLMSYGVSLTDLYRRAATYVDKLLKGAKPADLPVEQPTTFELVINMKTAKTLGLTIPSSVLARADQIIE